MLGNSPPPRCRPGLLGVGLLEHRVSGAQVSGTCVPGGRMSAQSTQALLFESHLRIYTKRLGEIVAQNFPPVPILFPNSRNKPFLHLASKTTQGIPQKPVANLDLRTASPPPGEAKPDADDDLMSLVGVRVALSGWPWA